MDGLSANVQNSISFGFFLFIQTIPYILIQCYLEILPLHVLSTFILLLSWVLHLFIIPSLPAPHSQLMASLCTLLRKERHSEKTSTLSHLCLYPYIPSSFDPWQWTSLGSFSKLPSPSSSPWTQVITSNSPFSIQCSPFYGGVTINVC